MKILHLSNLFVPAVGGLERHVATCTLELARRGHEVTVATMQPEHESWREFRDRGVQLVSLRSLTRIVAGRAYADTARPFHPTWRDPVVSRQLSRLVEGDDYDVVHSHDWLVHSLRLPRHGRRPLHVYTAHDYGLVCTKKTLVWRTPETRPQPCAGPGPVRCAMCAAQHYGLAKGVPLAAGLLLDTERAARSADVLLAISSAVAAQVARSLRAERDIEVVPTFVPDGLEEIAIATPAASWAPKEPFWFFCGRLSRDKGVHVLFEAYRQLADSLDRDRLPKLLCVGTPSDDDLGPVPPGVTISETVPHAQVMRCHLDALATIVPSVWNEPMGQVAVEALLVGTPVIASAVGGLPDVVIPGQTGLLVPPGDSAGLAAAMLRTLQEPETLRAMSDHGKHHAVQFTASRVVDRLEATYRARYNSAFGVARL